MDLTLSGCAVLCCASAGTSDCNHEGGCSLTRKKNERIKRVARQKTWPISKISKGIDR